MHSGHGQCCCLRACGTHRSCMLLNGAWHKATSGRWHLEPSLPICNVHGAWQFGACFGAIRTPFLPKHRTLVERTTAEYKTHASDANTAFTALPPEMIGPYARGTVAYHVPPTIPSTSRTITVPSQPRNFAQGWKQFKKRAFASMAPPLSPPSNVMMTVPRRRHLSGPRFHVSSGTYLSPAHGVGYGGVGREAGHSSLLNNSPQMEDGVWGAFT